MELDPLYVDTVIRRWQAMTGQSARRASDNAAFSVCGRSAGPPGLEPTAAAEPQSCAKENSDER